MPVTGDSLVHLPGTVLGRLARGFAGAVAVSAASSVVSRPFSHRLSRCPRQALSDRFIAHILSRNKRLEDDLVDHLFNASEQRLARTLLLLARYGKPDGANRVLPKISQTVLAEMVGTTRSRVNFFMNKFRKLGFIEYNGALKVHGDLLGVVLRDPSAREG
jgi:CRP-like cAMP-binding protein